MTDSEIVKLIDTMIDENALRSIRSVADNRLQEVKKQKELADKVDLEDKYRDKYLLIYGRTMAMMPSAVTVNKNDIKIVHVKEINFKGNGFFSCKAKVLHIDYDNESNVLKHLSSSEYGSCYVSYTFDDQFSLNERDIDKIITKEEALEYIKEAKDIQKQMIEGLDI